MPNLLRHLLFAATAATAATAGAQVTFWDGPAFAGQSFTANQTISNFADVGYNDRATSAVIRGGSWQLCGDAYFRGRCVSLDPGQYPDLGAVGLSYAISSARPLTGWPEGGVVGGGGGRVVLYDSSGFIGRTYDVNGIVANLDGTGFNDRALSMVVHEGTWQLCVDANFDGYCQTFGAGRYANLGRLSGMLSSLRPVGAGGGGSGVGGGGWGGGSRAILYEGPNLTGRTYVVSSQVLPNLDGTGFNDRATSLRVEGGYWIFCSDANFNGACQTFGPGDYPYLPGGLNNRISSGRRVSGGYPYNSTPNWSGQQ
ncbi:MAG: beta/gamma crystallin-related protein [Casimicrobiaceae bacterium]